MKNFQCSYVSIPQTSKLKVKGHLYPARSIWASCCSFQEKRTGTLKIIFEEIQSLYYILDLFCLFSLFILGPDSEGNKYPSVLPHSPVIWTISRGEKFFWKIKKRKEMWLFLICLFVFSLPRFLGLLNTHCQLAMLWNGEGVQLVLTLCNHPCPPPTP